MRIVVAGTKTPVCGDSWRPDITDALRRLGYRVTEIPTWDLTPELIRTARGADLLLWLRHQRITLDNTPVLAALRTLEAGGTTTASLHMDLYQNDARRHLIGKDAWWHTQHVFTTEGGHDWGRINHHWIAPATGTRYVGPGEHRAEYAHKACFTGTVHRVHGQHRLDLIDWARRTYGDGFAHYEAKRNPIWGHRLTDLYASAGVVLADSGISYGKHWADRVPKTLIRGGILAHPYAQGMDDAGLTDDVMIRYPLGDFDAIRERRDAMTEAEIKAMREAAIQTALERHTWRVRLTEMLNTMGFT